MAYLMGDSPSKQLSAHISAVVTLHRHAARKPGNTAPLDPDMESAGIHKGTGKHSHISYVQTAGRQAVFAAILCGQCLVTMIIAQTLMLIKQCHHLFHSLAGFV